MAVRTRAPIGIFHQDVDRVFFARLPAGSTADPRQSDLYASNFVDGKYVYLLNVPPGEYVAVAATRSQHGGLPAQPSQPGLSVSLSVGATDYTTYFDEDLIRSTATTVVPGAIAFAGTFTVDQSVGLKNADETQLHSFRLLAPGVEDRSMLGSLLSGDYHYRGTLREASHDLGDDGFLERARSHLKGSGWIAHLE